AFPAIQQILLDGAEPVVSCPPAPVSTGFQILPLSAVSSNAPVEPNLHQTRWSGVTMIAGNRAKAFKGVTFPPLIPCFIIMALVSRSFAAACCWLSAFSLRARAAALVSTSAVTPPAAPPDTAGTGAAAGAAAETFALSVVEEGALGCCEARGGGGG